VSKDQKERPEDSIANKPIVNNCFPIDAQKSKIVSQITPIKRDQENSIHFFLCVIEAEEVRRKANVHGSFAQNEIVKTLPSGAMKEGRCGIPLLRWEGMWAKEKSGFAGWCGEMVDIRHANWVSAAGVVSRGHRRSVASLALVEADLD
jgi:hypothetical protein